MEEEPRQPRRGPRPDKVGRGRWIGLAVVGTALLIVALWLYVQPDTATEKQDFIQAVGVLIAGLAGFVGLYFTWTNLDQTRRTTQRTLELTEQGQITERFTRAIDQLGASDDDGNPRLEVRLGGIYALERIDKESPERAYHSTVMEVLTAYVRENAPWPPKSLKSPEEDFVKPPGDSASVSASGETAEQDTEAEQGKEPVQGTPSTDIQAILEVIDRRQENDVPEEHRVPHLNLRGVDFRGVNLSGAHLEKVRLDGAHLEGADLREAHLQEAYLIGAQLERARLDGAHLEGAILREAHLERAELSGAHLEPASLYKAHLEAANLLGAHLKGADLREAHLEGAKLYGAHLEGARLWKAYLGRARLHEAHLEGAWLQGAHLEGAISLTPEQIQWTIGNERTELPEDLVDHRPSWWSQSTEEQIEIIDSERKQKTEDQ